jgi:hypothetical protein
MGIQCAFGIELSLMLDFRFVQRITRNHIGQSGVHWNLELNLLRRNA